MEIVGKKMAEGLIACPKCREKYSSELASPPVVQYTALDTEKDTKYLLKVHIQMYCEDCQYRYALDVLEDGAGIHVLVNALPQHIAKQKPVPVKDWPSEMEYQAVMLKMKMEGGE